MPDRDRIRVLIVDDHGMVRKGLSAYLASEEDIELVGEAPDGREALQLCQRLQPDVALMDLIMPEMGGVAATRIITERWPQTKVIALTSFREQAFVRDALQAGAIGYLLKNVSGEDLAAAIRSAHAGRPTLSPEALQALIEPDDSTSAVDYGLTPREREVLALLVEGLTNPEVALRLSISRSTVKVHVSNILTKLGVSNRREVIRLAVERKLAI